MTSLPSDSDAFSSDFARSFRARRSIIVAQRKARRLASTFATTPIKAANLCEPLESRLMLTTVSLHLNSPIITEGSAAAAFTFTRDNTVGNLTVDYRVGGSAPASQFAENFNGQLTFLNGQSTATLTATAVDDHVADPNRTLTIALTQPEGTSYSLGAVSQATTLVKDADGGQSIYHDLFVGPGQTYATVSAAVAASTDGNYIDVLSSGNYANDTAAISRNNITIRGIGDGRALMNWTSTTSSLPNQKGIILFQTGASNLTVENMELDGAWISSALGNNGAGIRAQGTNIVVTNCGMEHDQMGFLTGVGTVLVQYSEFGFNGAGDGLSHNIYINNTATTFTFQHNYSHDANQGHLLKSRAAVNRILYNYFDDGAGASSYEISTPNGGQTTIIGNVVVQETSSPNSTIIDYGSETSPNPPLSTDFLYVADNTVINYKTGGTFVRLLNLPTNFDFTLENNIFAGAGAEYSMGGSTTTPRLIAGNYVNAVIANAGFVNAAAGDYHLTNSSGAVGAAVALGSDPNGFALNPADEYVGPESYVLRATATDSGAFALKAIAVTPAPTLLSAVSDSTGKSVTLTWSNVGATSYVVQRKTGAAGTYAQVGSATSATTLVDSTASPDTLYFYQVIANGAGGPSVPSNAISLTTATPAPTLQNAVSDATGKNVTLTWTSVPTATGYLIERKTGAAGTYSQVGTAASGATSALDATTTPGILYYYEIIATGAGGNSIPSNALSLTTANPAPSAPKLLSATPASNGKTVTLSWTAFPGATGYQIYRRTGTGAFAKVATTKAGVTTLANATKAGTTYSYEVRATLSSGTSPFSNIITLTTPTLLARPTIKSLVSAATGNSVTATWSAVGGSTGYLIMRKTGLNGTYAQVGSVSHGSTVTFIDKTTAPNTTYYYQVIATDSNGLSLPSEPVTILTL